MTDSQYKDKTMKPAISRLITKITLVLVVAIGFVAPSTADEPSIEVISYGKLNAQDVESWTRAAAEYLSDWQADTLGVTWDVGRQTRERFSRDFGFSKHKVLLSKEQNEQLLGAIEKWMFESECLQDEYRAMENRHGLRDISLWVRGGASVATAPDPCYDRRMILLARTPDQDEKLAQKIWLHEFYHAHSNYLQNHCVDPRDPQADRKLDAFEPGRWFAEATAEYFAIMVSGQLQGIKDPVGNMLKNAKSRARSEGTDLFSDLAANSAVALRLLIERGNYPNLEADAMSGAIFHSCDWKDEWNLRDNPEARYAVNNWYQIQQYGNKWSFKKKALQSP